MGKQPNKKIDTVEVAEEEETTTASSGFKKQPADNTAADTATAEKSAADKAATDKAATDKVAADKTAGSKQGPPSGIAEPKPSTATNTQDVAGVKWNWAPNDFAKDLMNKKPVESKAAAIDQNLPGAEEEPTEEEKRAFISGELDEQQTPMTVEELMEVAELVIDILDTINSTAVGAFAGESAAKFELEASKRKRLAGFLARVFFKYQVRMGPVAGLILAALLYFGLTWKMGWDVKKEKKIDAEKKAADDQRAKNKARKDAFRNKIIAGFGVEKLTLKKLSERMGLSAEALKPEIEVMLNLGTLRADHSETPIKYSITD